MGSSGKWQHVKETTEIGEGKLFSPGNLRATYDNPEYDKVYTSTNSIITSEKLIRGSINPGINFFFFLFSHKQLINYYVKEKYTLRYTGGMVPDVNQVL